MFTHKDIEFRSIFVINCLEERNLRVSNGELLLEDASEHKTITKLPFQKLLALFVIGHITVTTPLIDKCRKNNVALVVMKPSLRPVFFFSATAEANFLLRQRQYDRYQDDLQIPRLLVINKTKNQLRLLEKTRQKNDLIESSKKICRDSIDLIDKTEEYSTLMGIEGRVAKAFFAAYFQQNNWNGRLPRSKVDAINSTLDIGYTVLFNYIEVFVRMFGFDPYRGVYHRLWFKRKSLVCDLMEPFRCLIDQQVRKSFNLKQFQESDFEICKNEYILKREMNSLYCKTFCEVLVKEKNKIFQYIQQYYRCFMQGKDISFYPEYWV